MNNLLLFLSIMFLSNKSMGQYLATNIKQYMPLKKDLLYKDNKGKVYLKAECRDPHDEPGTVNFCFWDEVVFNQSHLPLKKIIDIKTFSKFSDIYYKDAKHIYAITLIPIRTLLVLNINSKKAKVIGNYITDGVKIYCFTNQLKNVNVKSFHIIPELGIGLDNSKIFMGHEPASYEEFNLNITKSSAKDSLIRIYFPNEKKKTKI